LIGQDHHSGNQFKTTSGYINTGEKTMIKVYDNSTGAELGALSQEQLVFLTQQLEEEDAEDQDYYINLDTIDLFESRGADPELLALLRRAMGTRQEMEIRWERQ
jgi:hypothetical protein